MLPQHGQEGLIKAPYQTIGLGVILTGADNMDIGVCRSPSVAELENWTLDPTRFHREAKMREELDEYFCNDPSISGS